MASFLHFLTTSVVFSAAVLAVCRSFKGQCWCLVLSSLWFSRFPSFTRTKRAKSLLELELQKLYFAIFLDFIWRSPRALWRLFVEISLVYLLVFIKSQDHQRSKRSRQFPLWACRLKNGKTSLFYIFIVCFQGLILFW